MLEHELGLDPQSAVVVVYRAKRADRVKILLWDGPGVVLAKKRYPLGRGSNEVRQLYPLHPP